LLAGAISPYEELLGYEYLYSQNHASLKTISKETVQRDVLPSEAAREQQGLFEDELFETVSSFVKDRMDKTGFSVLVKGTYQFPAGVTVADNPVPILYCQGDVTLFDAPSVSIVGARKASQQGLQRAAQLARDLVHDGVVVVSGLAKGIDTAALTAAIQDGGHVIGVIGTPIDQAYPKENTELQKLIASDHLLVSQVPLYRYDHQAFDSRKYYFPERNVTMAAISKATVVVEASDTSGTLVQARACLKQEHKLFIMRSCLENSQVTWAEKMIEKGAVVLDSSQQLLDQIHTVSQ